LTSVRELIQTAANAACQNSRKNSTILLVLTGDHALQLLK